MIPRPLGASAAKPRRASGRRLDNMETKSHMRNLLGFLIIFLIAFSVSADWYVVTPGYCIQSSDAKRVIFWDGSTFSLENTVSWVMLTGPDAVAAAWAYESGPVLSNFLIAAGFQVPSASPGVGLAAGDGTLAGATNCPGLLQTVVAFSNAHDTVFYVVLPAALIIALGYWSILIFKRWS